MFNFSFLSTGDEMVVAMPTAARMMYCGSITLDFAPFGVPSMHCAHRLFQTSHLSFSVTVSPLVPIPLRSLLDTMSDARQLFSPDLPTISLASHISATLTRHVIALHCHQKHVSRCVFVDVYPAEFASVNTLVDLCMEQPTSILPSRLFQVVALPEV